VTRNGRIRRAAHRTDAHAASSIRSADGPAPVTLTIGLRTIGFKRSRDTPAVGSSVSSITHPPTRRP